MDASIYHRYLCYMEVVLILCFVDVMLCVLSLRSVLPLLLEFFVVVIMQGTFILIVASLFGRTWPVCALRQRDLMLPPCVWET